MTVEGIGIDLVEISRLRRVVERWRERFLQRVYTKEELSYCMSRRDPIPHLAARFAAKEAGLKALGTGLRMGIRWRELEVRRARGGAPSLHLSGTSRKIGRTKGAETLLLSITHDGAYAMAQAMLVSQKKPFRGEVKRKR